jgi:hypothetical protein
MNPSDEPELAKWHFRPMTVANIRDRAGVEYVEVVFLESTRFFRLPRKNPTFDDSYKLLREAMGKRHVLRVGLASPESDLIEEIEA